MTASDTAGKVQLISRDQAADDLGRAVRLFTRADSAWTIKRVAEEAGVSYRRLQDLIENDPAERRYASLDEALSIWAVIGTRGASTSLARIGMVAEPEEAETGAIARTGARLTMATAKLMSKAVDDEISADEADEVHQAAHQVIADAVALITAADKASRKARRR